MVVAAMASTGTFRVFISSTFWDFTAERDALQRIVVPELRAFCNARGANFQLIDLRWGISEEAGLDQRTIAICKSEIASCQRLSPRPNFILLLGERYGWQPLPFEIPEAEFEAIARAAGNGPTDDRSLLTTWYRLDRNADPPVYVLQPRDPGGEFAEQAWWSAVESRIRECLCRASAELPPGATPQGYDLSATHHEVLASLATEGDPADQVFAYFRTSSQGETTAIAEPEEPQAAAKLRAVRELLERAIPGNIRRYAPAMTRTGPLQAYLDALCTDIIADLKGVISRELSRLERQGALDRERAIQHDFMQGRAAAFVERASVTGRFSDFLRPGNAASYLCLFGSSGFGKSALLCHWVTQGLAELPFARIVYRFIGASPGSVTVEQLLRSLCLEFAAVLAQAGDAYADMDLQGLKTALSTLLSQSAKQARTILVIDALNQLEGPADLSWLPRYAAENIKIVLSCTHGAWESAVRQKFGDSAMLELPSLLPGEIEQIIDGVLARRRRCLTSEQCSSLMAACAANRSALYVKLATEEAARLRSYDAAPVLPTAVSELINAFLARLSRPENHGAVLVARALGYLAASRHGLSETELIDVLSADGDVIADFRRRSPRSPTVETLPFVVWSRLYSDLASFLSERDIDDARLLGFFHQQIEDVVIETCLHDDKATRHRHLARFFGGQPDCPGGDDWTALEIVVNRRKLEEYPYQLRLAEAHDQAAAWLQDFATAAAYGAANRMDRFAAELDAVAAGMPDVPADVAAWRSFCAKNIHFFRRGDRHWPSHKILLQRAMESGEDGFAGAKARRWLGQGRRAWRWFCDLHPQADAGPCLAVMEGHKGAIAEVLQLSDGSLLSWGDHIVSGDPVLRIWSRAGASLAVLEGLQKRVDGAFQLSGGDDIVAWGGIQTVCLWNADGALVASTKLPRTILGAAPRPGGFMVWARTGRIHYFDARGVEVDEAPLPWDRDFDVMPLSNGAVVAVHYRRSNGSRDFDRLCFVPAEGKTQHDIDPAAEAANIAELPDGTFVNRGGRTMAYRWTLDGIAQPPLLGHATPLAGVCRLLDGGEFATWDEAGLLILRRTAAADYRSIRLEDLVPSRVGRLRDGRLFVTDGRRTSIWTADYSHRTTLTGEFTIELADRIVTAVGPRRFRTWTRDLNLVTEFGEATEERSSFPKFVWMQSGRVCFYNTLYESGIQVFDPDGTVLGALMGHGHGVRGAMPLDATTLLTWSGDATLRLWDIEALGRNPAATDQARADKFAADFVMAAGGGHILTSRREIREARIWTHDGALEATVPALHYAHASPNPESAFAFPCGAVLSFAENELWLWADGRLKPLPRHEAAVNGCVGFLGHTVLCWGGSSVRMFAADGREVARIAAPEFIWNVSVDEGRRTALACGGNVVTIARFGVRDFSSFQLHLTHDLRMARFIDDDHIVVVGLYDRELSVCDVARRQVVAQWRPHRSAVHWVHAVEGRRLVTASGDAQLKIWTTAGELVATVPVQHEADIVGRRWILTRRQDLRMMLLDLDGRCIALLGERPLDGWAAELGGDALISWSRHGFELWDSGQLARQCGEDDGRGSPLILQPVARWHSPNRVMFLKPLSMQRIACIVAGRLHIVNSRCGAVLDLHVLPPIPGGDSGGRSR